MSIHETSPILQFFVDDDRIVNHLGFSLSAIINKVDDPWLNDPDNNYIGWCFPILNQTTNKYNTNIYNDFKKDSFLQERLLHVFLRMTDFYGLHFTHKHKDESNANNYSISIGNTDHWIESHNHNYIKISRMLRSTNHLGLQGFSYSMFELLDHVYHKDDNKKLIGSKVFDSWYSAVLTRAEW
ncbi:MAG: opioid growth factor receptor-related protein [Saprospiraceae bacterium]